MSKRFHIENSHFAVCFNCCWKGKFVINSIKIYSALFWLINSDSFTSILKSKNQITIHNEIHHIRKKKKHIWVVFNKYYMFYGIQLTGFYCNMLDLNRAKACQLISPRLCKRIFFRNMMVSHRNYINNV